MFIYNWSTHFVVSLVITWSFIHTLKHLQNMTICFYKMSTSFSEMFQHSFYTEYKLISKWKRTGDLVTSFLTFVDLVANVTVCVCLCIGKWERVRVVASKDSVRSLSISLCQYSISVVAQGISMVLIRCCSGAWDRASGQSPQWDMISHSLPW